MKAVDKGDTITWFEVCNENGMQVSGGKFRSAADAAVEARAVCAARQMITTVVEHSTTVLRVFRSNTQVVED